MAVTINASTSAGLVQTADTSGVLALQTAGTTAVTVDASQNATFAGSVKTNTLTSASATALTLQSAGTTAITVDTSQRIGVGTVTPQRKLSIVGTDGATGQTEGNSRTSLFLDNNGANYLSIFTGTSGDGGVFFSDNGSNNGGMVYETSNDALYFRSNNAERMRITSGGNVGINTTPVAMSNGVGTQTGQATIVQNIVGDQSLFANNAYYDSSWKAVRAQTGYSCMRPGAMAGGIQFMCSSVTTTAGGNLPNMDGSDIKLQIYPTGNIGAPSGSNIYNASDARLKKNIQPLTKGLDAVVALKPVSFNWITDFCEDENDKTLYGFVAQDTREVDENLVEGFSKGGSIIIGDLTVDSPMRVNEKFIIPMLAKAIQELKAINDTQAETINALTARIVALEAK
jgi:hypothetical protein